MRMDRQSGTSQTGVFLDMPASLLRIQMAVYVTPSTAIRPNENPNNLAIFKD